MPHRFRSSGRHQSPGLRTTYLAAPLVGALLAGCGAGSSAVGPTGHATFLAAVDKVCARSVAAHAGHPFPLPNFNPERPDPNQLPQVADYFAHYGGLRKTTRALHQLTPPRSDAADWRHLLRIAEEVTLDAQRQIAAARERDVTTFVKAVRASKQLTAQINTAGQHFGLPNCPRAARYSASQ
jgi:hypothetical protein